MSEMSKCKVLNGLRMRSYAKFVRERWRERCEVSVSSNIYVNTVLDTATDNCTTYVTSAFMISRFILAMWRRITLAFSSWAQCWHRRRMKA